MQNTLQGFFFLLRKQVYRIEQINLVLEGQIDTKINRYKEDR